MTFEYVCYSITTCCNLNCKYCYRVESDEKSVDKKVFFESLKVLKKLGCRIINISGGEPLLHSEWRLFVKQAYEMGFQVVLSTNGMFLDLYDDALKYVKEIAISLDGSNEEINAVCRGNNSFNCVVNNINQYREGNFNYVLKVGTVLTQNNYSDILNIIPIIDKAGIYWRIFYYRNKGVHNQINSKWLITKKEYLEKINELNSMMPQTINFMYDCCLADVNEEKETVIITPDTSMYIGNNSKDVFIGKIRSQKSEEIKERLIKNGFIIGRHKLYYNEFI